MSFGTGNDNRRHPRTPFKRSVRYHGKGQEIVQGHMAHDLSQSGIRMNSAVFLPVGSKVQLQLQLADQERVHEIEGSVVWVRQIPYREEFQVGVEFAGGASFNKWEIARFVVRQQ